MSAAAAPLIAFGPPGWAAFAVLTVGTVGLAALAASRSRSISRSRAEPIARTDVAPCPPRPWSVRVHAQGTDIGGTTGSTTGAPPIVQMSPISAGQGVALATATYGMLGRRQQQNRAVAYEKCIEFIQSRPANGGFLGSKSFYASSRDNNRLDVDSYGPSNNFVS